MENPIVILTAKEVSVHYGEQIILDNASLTINEGERIGLLGRNGTGKSTFLKIISGFITPDSGEVTKRKELNIGFLPQEFILDETKNVIGNIKDGTNYLTDLIHQYETLPFDSSDRELIEKQIIAKDGWNLEKKIELLMSSLKCPPGNTKINNLSGGEKRRVALCRALISQPDLLILDEPTNHLDTSSIEWIENYLANYKGTCIFVTHDRYFLDKIADRIVELSNGLFFSHDGNYTDYLINKAERLAIKESEEKKRQNFLRRELEWVRRGPKARTSKSKSRLDNYFEIAEKRNDEPELDIELLIPPYESVGNTVLDLFNLQYSIENRLLFREVNFMFKKGRKLGIVGNNGTGKTTLLKIILGEITPDYGKVEIGDKTEFNYIDQNRLLFDENETVFQSIGKGAEFIKFGNQQINTWTYLRRFLFTDDRINTIVERLSGGERSRLALAHILKNGGNFLIFDEPTNDLDLPSLRILEETLIAFEGCLIIVSHDRYFLNRVCNGILAIEDEGNVHFSEGNYDYYVEKKKERQLSVKVPNIEKKKEDSRIKIKQRKLSWNESKELETIEEKILLAEEEASEIENIFASPDFYEKYASKTNELKLQLDEAKNKIELLYKRWEELENIKNVKLE